MCVLIYPATIYWTLSICQTESLFYIITHSMFNSSFSIICPEEFKREWMNRCWGKKNLQWNEFLPLVKSWVSGTQHHNAAPHLWCMKGYMWLTLFLGSSLHLPPWSGAAAFLTLLDRSRSCMTLRCCCSTDIIFHRHFHHRLGHVKCCWWLKVKSWG